MAWRVELTERALADLDALYDTIHAGLSEGAARWFARLQDHIALLAISPHMGKPTQEDTEVRELIHGRRPHLYRVLYLCDENTETAFVLAIRHGKRLPPQ